MGQAASEHGGHSGPPHSGPHTGSHVCPPQSVHTGPTSGSHGGMNSGPHSELHAGSYLDPQTGYSTGPLRGPRKGPEAEVNGSANLEYLRHEPFRDAFETGRIFNRGRTRELETHGVEVGVTSGADSIFTIGESNFWGTHVIPSLTDLNCDMNGTLISCGSNAFYRSHRSVLCEFIESEVSREVTNEDDNDTRDENVGCKEHADSDSVKTSNSDDLYLSENTEVAKKKRKRYRKKTTALLANGMPLELTDSSNNVDRIVLPSDCDIEPNENTPDEVKESVNPISGEKNIGNVINLDNVRNSSETVVMPQNSDSMFTSEDAMSVPEVPVSAEVNDTIFVSSLDHSPLSTSVTTTSFQSSSSDYVTCESMSKSVDNNHVEKNLTSCTIDKCETSPSMENLFLNEENCSKFQKEEKCSFDCIKSPVMVTPNSSVCNMLKDVSFKNDNLLANSTSKSGKPALSVCEINPTVMSNLDAISNVAPLCDNVGFNTVSSSVQNHGPSSVNDVHPISSLKETLTNKTIVSPQIDELLGPFSAQVIRVFPRSGVASFNLHGVSTRAFFFFKDVNYIALKVGAWVILENLVRVKSCANTNVYGTTLHAQTVSIGPSKDTKSLTDKMNSPKSVVCPNVSLSTDLKSVALQQVDSSSNKNVPVSANNNSTISSNKKVELYIPVNANQAKDSLPVCAKPKQSIDEELIGPYFATIVVTFPKSAVASLLLNGTTKRVFFFLKNILEGFIPPIGTNVILKDLSVKYTDNNQFVSTYGTKLCAEIVSVVVSQEAITGRTGCIVKYVAKNCGVLELNLPNEKIHGKFTTAQVTRIDLGEKTLEEVWPVGNVVHFQGELVKTKVKKEFLVTSVWPQGGLATPITKTNDVNPLTEVIKSATKTEKILAHTGRVSKYVSHDKGVIEFRLGELYLKSDFQSSLCVGLCTSKFLSQQWPPGTIVHFDGVLTRSPNDPTFRVLSVWSKRQPIQTSISKAVPELPRASQITGPHVGQIIEFRLPGAFVISLPLFGQMVKVFVLSMNFRKSLKEPQLKKMVSVEEIVYIGQRIVVSMKPSSPDNKKDCDYVAIDAWPETEVLSISTPVLTAKPLNKNSLSNNALNENSKLEYANMPTDRVQTLLPPQSVISFKSSALNETHPDSGTVEQSANLKLSNGEPRSNEPTSIVKLLGLPSSAAKALTARLGPPRLGCVVRTMGEAVLFRVKIPGMTVQAAAMAPDIQLCGVPLDGIDLTLVLAPGQELDVHLLPEDEKHIFNTEKCSTSNATLSWQNHFYVSVLWLGRAHLETSSMQFAELTNFCLAHKVPNTVRHKLTHRLGQILEKDGRKKIVHSSDEDDYGKAVENQKKKAVKKKNDSKATHQLRDPSIEKAVVEKLKDLGPENFLRLQLKQLIHSVLKESVHAAQEFFLTSLKEYCGSTPVHDILLAETPDIIESAIQEYFVEKQKKAQVEGSLRYSATPAQPANGAGDACADGVSVSAQTAARAAAAAVAARAVASCMSSASVARSATPRVTPEVAPSVARSLENAKVVFERNGEWGDGGECGSKVREAAAAPEAACRLLHGAQEVLQQPKEGLQATAHVPHSAMQEPVRKQSQIDVADKLAVERSSGAAASEFPVEAQKPPVLDTAETGVTGEPDKRDYQKTLSAELQKHARELALFRDEACSLIENWKSADSPPATPEELEFLQELSLLLDNRVEGGGKTGKNEEDTSVAQQLIKFWNTANFPLTPVAQRGLQRLQELFGVPDKKMEGSEKDCLGSSGDGLVEVEAALKEVRDAFRDVKHVFEVQRCFRDLRECFRDVRRAYRGREPRPRALPPCADAPAAAAAAAALAEAVVQVKKRGRNIPGVTGSRTPSPTQTSPQAQSRKKAQLQCSTCKAGILSGASGEDASTPTNDTTSQRIIAEKSKIEVSSKSSQTTASMDTTGDSLPATSEQSAQTISTGAVLALHLLPDQ